MAIDLLSLSLLTQENCLKFCAITSPNFHADTLYISVDFQVFKKV